jgi:hypothetical protein
LAGDKPFLFKKHSLDETPTCSKRVSGLQIEVEGGAQNVVKQHLTASDRQGEVNVWKYSIDISALHLHWQTSTQSDDGIMACLDSFSMGISLDGDWATNFVSKKCILLALTIF